MPAGGGSGISWKASTGALPRDSATIPAMTTDLRMAIHLADKMVLPRAQCKTRMKCRLRPSHNSEKTAKNRRKGAVWLAVGRGNYLSHSDQPPTIFLSGRSNLARYTDRLWRADSA